MKLLTSLVSVKRINSSVPRSNFNEEDIEKASQAILDAEGIINPIILEKTDLESYEVFSGYFEYYAAVRAREIDPRKGEMIGAFIMENDKEDAIKKQIEILRSPSTPAPPIIDTESQRLFNLESRLTNIEMRSEIRINELKQDHQNQIDDLKNQIKEIQKNIHKTVEALQAFNTFSLEKLTSELIRVNFANKSKIISNIIKARETKGEFKSFADLINKVDKLGDKTVIKIIDHFSN
ncbi:hypothetical protein [Crocosphaera sp. XPORK-15E]|uniref:ParB N-terminal domain-containing protein n=1 Tax=Crocosphaera sp. XPORK-15E TaxID=3110247 RepID=UPI002B1EE497|nr:hypothetical protein [Crocosphaera sp. XPORK-15E]MEA5534946.1 hypothetical protein [Crocosphaera sp. XPORK-15E]